MRKLALLVGGFAIGAVLAVGAAPSWSSNGRKAEEPQQLTLVLSRHAAHRAYNLAVRPDVPVRLTIVNRSREAHTFTIPDLGINQIVPPALGVAPTRTVVTFTTPYGMIRWRCEVCHEEMYGDIFAVITERSPGGWPPGGFHW